MTADRAFHGGRISTSDTDGDLFGVPAEELPGLQTWVTALDGEIVQRSDEASS